MIKGSLYTTLNGEVFSLADLDRGERRLVNDLIARQRSVSEWTEYANYYMRAVGDFYRPRGLTGRAVTSLPVWKIAQDLKSRLMVRAGEALPPDYRDKLGALIRSDFPTQKAFCEATGLSEDLVSHVLARRKHLAIDTLSDALKRIGYQLQIVPAEKA
ncbi:MAG: hypothetical protein J2P46_10685 [Zavarzinella sp.]|nr:hypothetical protein [Zavarzinella sp.]